MYLVLAWVRRPKGIPSQGGAEVFAWCSIYQYAA